MSRTCLSVAAVVLLALFANTSSTPTKQRPNIIIMLADDLGWNDVSFHGSDQIPTPNIDALAYHGVILNNHYAPALCTPSRAALMTGKYPTHTGMQHLVILEPEPWGLPLSEKILPQHLKRAGYATHAIGKWHLGFFKKEYTPTYRGFDSHFGYWNGFQDYYDHTVKATNSPFAGYDMRRNMSVDYSAAGKYSTDLYTDEAVSIIRRHDQSRGPLFLYLAHLAPHTGNQDNPFQAPDEEIAKFRHIEDPERRVYAAMVSRMDKSVGDVMAALRESNMLDNSIIVFMSDHGAPTHGIHSNRGSNWPFRGQKHSPWEGGVRAVAAVWSPLLKRTQRVSNQLMHMTDWLPTLYSAAGMDVRELGRVDGVDMWASLSEGAPSPRSEVLHNIDDIYGYAALVRGGWKYVTGSTGGAWDGWYGEPRRRGGGGAGLGHGAAPAYDVARVLASKTGVALAGFLTERQLLEKMAAVTVGNTGGVEEHLSTQLLSEETVARLRHEAEVRCPPRRADNASEATQCRPMEAPCLFNLREDPCETVNLAASQPLLLRSLQEAVQQYRLTMVPPNNVPVDPRANPAFYNNTWAPWQDVPAAQQPFQMKPSPTLNLAVVVTVFLAVALGITSAVLRAFRTEKDLGKEIVKALAVFNISPALKEEKAMKKTSARPSEDEEKK
ncbi:arylsulfatase J-like [Schistocerca serialis cubense]|uniref:arylsulfatase J-like n=1 Tax=Schistocerca serialis cubense TaxID=2023355 RepID=UPI00214F2974|nr:arylsulfatase J-like [Schistocerca serialis cubense]XP_049956679.1 arylsulfatase J-like [Schistocerca serialis cubense]